MNREKRVAKKVKMSEKCGFLETTMRASSKAMGMSIDERLAREIHKLAKDNVFDKLNDNSDPEGIDHPAHYGGNTVYETIKVIEAWDLNFNLGNAVKYISRADEKDDAIRDLKKAVWYLQREIATRERENMESEVDW